MVTDARARGGRQLDRIEPRFDDPRVVANAGLLLAATLAARLGLERLVDEAVRLRSALGRGAGGREGALAGVTRCCSARTRSTTATCCARARPAACSATACWRPRRSGRSCAAFTFGHVRQLDRVLAEALRRAWQRGRRARQRALGDRRRLVCVRGPWRQQAGRGLRLHPQARLPPDHRDALRHARDAAHPSA